MPKLRILIVDDHEVLRKGIRTLLRQRKGWSICGEAGTAEAAIKETRRLKPDVVTLDISLPDSNGLVIIPRILKASPRTAIVVLTMHDSGQTVCRALAAGVQAVVLKCDAARDLLTAIEAASQRRMFLSGRVQEALQRMGLETESSLDVLTPREGEVLRLLAEGRTSKEIAAHLNISPKTVETHRTNLMGKLNLRSLSELTLFAIRKRILQP